MSDREIKDLRAALEYLSSRPDVDPSGFGILGVSKGGSTALCVAAEEPRIWGVITDSAFPTRGMLLHYMLRWAEIYSRHVWKYIPGWIFQFLAWTAQRSTEKARHCRFANIERAVAKIGPRPWLMIHGEKDGYVTESIARGLFERARRPKELWIVENAKHNGCRQQAPETYRARLAEFFARFAPRRPGVLSEKSSQAPIWEAGLQEASGDRLERNPSPHSGSNGDAAGGNLVETVKEPAPVSSGFE